MVTVVEGVGEGEEELREPLFVTTHVVTPSGPPHAGVILVQPFVGLFLVDHGAVVAAEDCPATLDRFPKVDTVGVLLDRSPTARSVASGVDHDVGGRSSGDPVDSAKS